MNIIRKIQSWYYRKYYVLLDETGQSVTLSHKLFLYIKHHHTQLAVFMFRAMDSGNYCFAFLEDFKDAQDANTYCSILQQNQQYNCVGFHQETPSVSAIINHYNCHPYTKVKLSVFPRRLSTGERFYELQPS